MAAMKVPKAVIFMADNGQDPTEIAMSWKGLADAGFQVDFATETGKVGAAYPKMLEKSIFGAVLGAKKPAADTYHKMTEAPAFQSPRTWSQEGFDVLQYDAIILPGGHDKPMRQYLESPSLHKLLAQFWPFVRRDYTGKSEGATVGPKVVGAICHGALCLAFAQSPETGKSLLDGVESTTLPKWMEATAWTMSQAWFMGGYYRTYGPEGRWCNDDIMTSGGKYVSGPMSQSSFTHTDLNYRYVSARFPGDAQEFASKVVAEVKLALGVS